MIVRKNQKENALYLRSMQVDVLIIGQGICGTLLSWFLKREGKTFLVIDNAVENTASKAAAGVINPVTGRRYVTSWMTAELLYFAKLTYTEIGLYLNTTLLCSRSIIDFFPSPQMRNAFVDRISEDDTYLHAYPDQNSFNPYFNYDFGCGEVRPAYMVNVQALLALWRKKLTDLNGLREEKFIAEEIKIEGDNISYQNITAQRLVFCDGISSAESQWFSLLPFSANKGEALLIECEDISAAHIYKKGLMLAPLPDENTFWLGSNYQWEFKDNEPSQKFYEQATQLLNKWVKKPYKVLAHKAAIRPATLERRPFVGFHPRHPAIGILNGMGTKGTSLAPYFAHQLAQNIIYDFPIAPEADVRRFSRILSK
jgi:glycine/D-amino acid oxidase-like deaminating enzyme